MRAGLALLPVALAFSFPVSAAAGIVACPYSELEFTPGPRASVQRAMLCEVNQERLVDGLRPLRLDRRLSRGAARHVKDMLRRRYVAHVSPAGVTPARRALRAGYGVRARRVGVGEVIGVGWTGLGLNFTPRDLVTRWLWSPQHRRVVLGRRYRDMGVAAVVLRWGSAYAAIVVADLGSRK